MSFPISTPESGTCSQRYVGGSRCSGSRGFTACFNRDKPIDSASKSSMLRA